MAIRAASRPHAWTFWQRMNLGMALFILLAFAQFAARGMVDVAHAPAIFHVHGMLMVTWLGLIVTQSLLAGRGHRAWHMMLGWVSVAQLPAIVIVGSYTCLTALALGLQPPLFTPGYFLALVHVGVLAFAAMVVVAVVQRGKPDWHRRLMLGSTILLLEPALGRVLPMPLIAPWGEWAALAVQLGVAGLIVSHDKRTTGSVHPATIAVMISVTLAHVVVELLARVPDWQDLAARIAA